MADGQGSVHVLGYCAAQAGQQPLPQGRLIVAAVLRRIIIPQAMRVIVPPTGNETISMLKTTSLVTVIPVTTELFFQAQAIGNRTFQPFPMAIMASIWYLALTSVLMVGQYYLERRYARGSQRDLPPTPIQRLKRRLGIGVQS